MEIFLPDEEVTPVSEEQDTNIYPETDLMHMSPGRVNKLFQAGKISQFDAEKYLEKHDSPLTFYAKDAARGVVSGLGEYVATVVDYVEPLADWLSWAGAEAGIEEFDPDEASKFNEVTLADELRRTKEEAEEFTKTYSLLGDIAEVGTEFAADTWMFGRMFKAVGATKWFKGFAEAGKAQSIVAGFVQNGAKYYLAEQIAFDPHEERLSDLVEHFPGLSNPIAQYLMSNEDDSDAEGRFKMSLESALLDTGIYGLSHMGTPMKVAFRVLKRRMWRAGNGDPVLVGKIMDGLTGGKIGRKTSALMDEVVEETVEKANPGMAASQIKEGTIINAETMGEIEARVLGGNKGIEAELASVLKEHGRDSFQDWMNPQKMGARLIERLKKNGVEYKAAKAEVTPVIEEYTELYNKVANSEIPKAPRQSLQKTKLSDAQLTDLADSVVKLAKGWDSQDSTVTGMLENFARIETSDEAKKLLNVMARKKLAQGHTEVYTRGQVAHKTSERLSTKYTSNIKKTAKRIATTTGTDTGEVLETFMFNEMSKTFDNIRMLEAKMLAYDEFVVAYDEFLLDTAKKLDAKGGGTIAEMVDFKNRVAFFYEIQGLSKGITTETARALSSKRIMRSALNLDINTAVGKQTVEAIESMHGESLRGFIRKYRELPNRELRAKYARTRGKHWFRRYFGDPVIELYQANLVSSLATHGRNLRGTAGAILHHYFTEGMAAAGMSVKHKSMQPLKEVMTELRGMTRAAREAVRTPDGFLSAITTGRFRKAFSLIEPGDDAIGQFWRTLKTGEPISDFTAKFADQRLHGGAIPGFPGQAIRANFHLLAAEDEFFKSMVVHGQLEKQAHKMALAEMQELAELKGTSWSKDQLKEYYNRRVAHYVAEPTDEAMSQAIKVGRELTYTQGLDAFGGSMNKLLNMAWFPKLFVPFFQVPYNLFKFGFKISPVNAKLYRDLFKGDSATKFKALSMLTTGWGITSATGFAYRDGLITGAIPLDQRASHQNAGIQEYSIRIGNEWVSYASWEPIATMMGLTCDLCYLAEHFMVNEIDLRDAMQKITYVVASNITNKTFMKGLNDVLSMFSDPKEVGRTEKAAYRIAENMVPYSMMLKDIQDQFNDELKDVRSFTDAMWRDINKGKVLPKRHAVYGHPLHRDKPFIWTGGIDRTRKMTDDKALLDMALTGANVGPLPWTWRKGHTDVKLTPKERDELYQVYESLPIKEVLNSIYSGMKGKVTDHAIRATIYKQSISKFRQAAWGIYIGTINRRMLDEYIADIKQSANAMAKGQVLHTDVTRLYHWDDPFNME